MIPVGRILTVISILIIIISFPLKKMSGLLLFIKKHRLFNFWIAIFISSASLFLVTSIFSFLVYTGASSDNNIVLIREMTTKCNPIQERIAAKNIILRIDDVQAFGWSDVSIRMINDAFRREMPVVLGVIPKNIKKDHKIARYLKRNECNIEIALHGYDHSVIFDKKGEEYGEFAFLDFNSARRRIVLAKEEIKQVIDKDINVFIPPNNQISKEAIIAAKKEGLNIVSGRGEDKFDYHSKTWSFEKNELISPEETIAVCEKVFSSGGDLCIIMIHPQDYIDVNHKLDEGKYVEYIKLLDYISEKNISVLTFNSYTSLTPTSIFNRNLCLGDEGSDVLSLQILLNKNGFTVSEFGAGSLGEETIYFGKRTQSAIMNYQSENGIMITGCLDTITRNHIEILVGF